MHHPPLLLIKAISLLLVSAALASAAPSPIQERADRIMEKGGTEDWRKVLKDATGEELSTRAVVEYFKPLQSWLEAQNKGCQIGWE